MKNFSRCPFLAAMELPPELKLGFQPPFCLSLQVTLAFFWKTALQESSRTKFRAPEHSTNQLSRSYILQELRADKSLLHRDLKLSSLRKADQGTAQD